MSTPAAENGQRCLWRPDGGVQDNGDCGGDIQRGDSYSVRLVHPDMPGSLITISFYAVEYDEHPGEFVVQREVEWMICEDPADPGGTEEWSDVSYTDMEGLVIHSVAEAERDAAGHAEYVFANPDLYGCWDGRRDAEHGSRWS